MRLRALTYNIRSGTDLFSRARLMHQGTVLREAAADLVMLQEVSSREQVQRLAALARLPYLAFGSARRTHTGEFGNALLSRWPLVNVENVLVPPAWRISQPRTVLAATISVEGHQVHALAAHFGLLPGEPELAALTVLSLAASRAGPLIVGGDLNRPLRGAVCHRQLRRALWTQHARTDAWLSRRFPRRVHSYASTTCTFAA